MELDNVSVSLSGRRILHGITWRWRRGESWAVLGANGSGKSTFLRLVAGELHPDPVAGGRRTYGLNGEVSTNAAGVREQVAFVSPEQQERYLNLEWVRTGRDVLLTGFHQTDYLYRRLTPEQLTAARKLAEELRLGPLLRRDVQTLSQGEFRRVLIARALLGKPRVLLLDEFTDGLDAAMRATLLAAVQRVAEAGTSVLLATHRDDELLPALRRRLVLEDGRTAPAAGRVRLRRTPFADAGGASAASISGNQSEKLAPLASLRSQWGSTESRPTSPAAPGAFLFRLRNVSVYLDRKPVLKDLSWEMRAGEHWAITGPNGSGKSTLLKLLLGELHPAVGGTIHRFGEPQRHTLWEIRARTGYVGPDLQTAYRDALTAREVVASGYFASIGLLDAVTRTQWRRVDAVLAELSLSDLARKPFLHLSYGQRRRVLLARALMHRPQVLLLDEPLDGLDGESLGLMRAHLLVLSRWPISLVVVTHRREELPPVTFSELAFGSKVVRTGRPV